jgi:hypothetical protein
MAERLPTRPEFYARLDELGFRRKTLDGYHYRQGVEVNLWAA